MSIGNLKDTGNQGNNLPWQYKVLQGLQCICDELKEININTDDIETLLQDIIDQLLLGLNVTVVNGAGAAAVNIQDGGNSITTDTLQLPAVLGQTNMAGSVSVTLANDQLGIVRTPTILRTSASLSVAAGTFSMSFASVGTANATVGGQILQPGETINFDAGAINNTLGAVVYDSSAVGAELLIITLT